MNNPLLTPFETAPFSKIKNEHFSPAIHHFIAVTKTQINEISENKEAPTFKNTIEALDGTGIQLDRITSIFFNLNSAETNDEIQKIAQEISPALSDFKNDLLLNEKLFKRVKQVYENRTSLSLNKEQTMLLKKSYIGFTRNGANLSYKDKDKLREIDGKLSKLKLQFGENVLAETNKFYLQITNEKELSGLPDGVIEMAAQTAKEKKNDWMGIHFRLPKLCSFCHLLEPT
jgi:peptidyl-dipeptidase Dcp